MEYSPNFAMVKSKIEEYSHVQVVTHYAHDMYGRQYSVAVGHRASQSVWTATATDINIVEWVSKMPLPTLMHHRVCTIARF